MSMKEDVEEMKKLVKTAQEEEQSLAIELLQDQKRSNKRMFIIWICTFFGLLLSVGYIVYLLNDVNTETIDIQEVESIDGSTIKIGDDIWEKSK